MMTLLPGLLQDLAEAVLSTAVAAVDIGVLMWFGIVPNIVPNQEAISNDYVGKYWL